MRHTFHSTDIHEHAGALPGWQQRYDQLSRGKLDGSLSLTEVAGVSVFRERLNQSAVQHMRLPEGAVNVILPLSWQHAEEDLSSDTLAFMPSQGEFSIVSPADMDVLCLSIGIEALRPLASESAFERLGARETLQSIRLSHQRKAHALTALLALLDGPQEGARAEANAQEVMLLAADWLEALEDEPRALPCVSTRRYIVNRCHQWLLEEPDSALSVIDLCKRLKVSRRTLQYSFQSIAGVTPVQYLRSVRLNGARRVIRERPLANISDIAASWGFSHTSYFSLEYQKLFGELPSAMRKLLGEVQSWRAVV
ncbi:helix-turn-helix domain-containing protein [Pseudomonas sp. X10]